MRLSLFFFVGGEASAKRLVEFDEVKRDLSARDDELLLVLQAGALGVDDVGEGRRSGLSKLWRI